MMPLLCCTKRGPDMTNCPGFKGPRRSSLCDFCKHIQFTEFDTVNLVFVCVNEEQVAQEFQKLVAGIVKGGSET